LARSPSSDASKPLTLVPPQVKLLAKPQKRRAKPSRNPQAPQSKPVKKAWKRRAKPWEKPLVKSAMPLAKSVKLLVKPLLKPAKLLEQPLELPQELQQAKPVTTVTATAQAKVTKQISGFQPGIQNNQAPRMSFEGLLYA
jgi:hypothetical protein